MEMDMFLSKEDAKCTYITSVGKFKSIVSRLPDDAKIMIIVEKDYGDKIRSDLSEMECFKRQGNTLFIGCTTKV